MVPRYTLYPTAFPSPGTQEISTWWEPGATPVPVNCSTVGEFTALLTNPALPEAVPDPFGVNRTVTGMLCPAGIVTGRFSPRRANSELVDWSDEMVTEAFEAVSVASSLTLDPTVTFPKLRVAGLTPSQGFAVASPNPVAFIVSLESLAVLTSSKKPVLYP